MPIPNNTNKNPENPSIRQSEINENDKNNENLFSPRFRSVAAMAGWDEEALLIASLIVEDTPDRQLKHKKRSNSHSFKTPPSNSKRWGTYRKCRALRRSPASIPIAVLDLDEDESKLEKESDNKTSTIGKFVEKSKGSDEVNNVHSLNTKDSDVPIRAPALPCLDRLREELSCAVCLEICYEPTTTPCGHSFCKRCLRSAANRCGKKCPKCRQLISNSRYCTVNTVLWNTIQLLFPEEVEARKANDVSSSDIHETTSSRSQNMRNIAAVQALNSPDSESSTGPEGINRRNRNRVSSSRQGFSNRTVLPRQDEDAALALRLQREEFMEAFKGPDERSRDSVAAARANLRAMASRAINIRIRGRRD